MKNKEIKDVLDSIIREYSGESAMEDYHGQSLIRDMELDSVSLMEVITDIEEKFCVDFNMEEKLIELLDSYDRLLEYLCKKVGEKCEG